MFTSNTIGLSITDTAIYIANVSRKGDLLTTATIPLADGIVQKGDIVDAGKLITALKKAAKKLGNVKRATLCISPQKVYVGLAHTSDKPTGENVEPHAAFLFPEETIDLHIAFRGITSNGEQHIGIAAVRKDVLSAYKDACKEAGIAVDTVTTEPDAIASVHADVHTRSILLRTYDNNQSSVTVIDHGFPIDEAMLLTSTDAKLLKMAADMIAEYADDDQPITNVLVASTPELTKKAQTKFGKATKTSDTLTVTALSTKKGEEQYIGAMAAAQGSNFALSGARSKSHKVLITLGVLAAGAIAGAAAYWAYVK